MTDDTRERTDDEVLDLLAASLTEDGELLPTTEAEVARVEEDLEATELPEGLEQLSFEEDGSAEVTDLQDYKKTREQVRTRTSPWTHGVALLIGAAAALLLKVNIGRETGTDPAMSGDPAGVPSTSSSAVEPERAQLTLKATCEDCCGGSACAEAKPELATCGSERRCIACDSAVLADSRYRVRVGAVTPSPLGVAVLKEYPKGEPELCFRAGVAKEVCVDTLISDRPGGRWTQVPAVFSGEDLNAKLTIRLRWKGVARESLATAGVWTMPVALTPKALCSGYTVELRNEAKEELFGTLSLFVDDAHYVEIARARGTAPLRDLRKRLVLDGVRVQLFETTAEGDRRFVLTTGPHNRTTAKALRWQLLEQDQKPAVEVGLDYVGDPLPLP